MTNYNTKPARFSVTGLVYNAEHGCWVAEIAPAYGTHTTAFLRKDDRPRTVRGPILRKEELLDACKFVVPAAPSTAAAIVELLVTEANAGRLIDPARDERPYCATHDLFSCWVCEEAYVKANTPEPEEAETEAPEVPASSEVVERLEAMIDALTGQVEDLEKRTPRTIEVQIPERQPVEVDGLVHEAFTEVLTVMLAGELVYLKGPAGTGKTTLAETLGEALDLPVHVDSMHEMMTLEDMVGFLSPTTGQVVRSTLAEALLYAFSFGGVVMVDEIDGGNGNAVKGMNNLAIAKEFHFPGTDAPVKRHPDFHLIASANTFGTGPDAEYVGANAIDASTLNRFSMVPVGYDQNIESTLASEFLSGERLDVYLTFCWQARKQIADEQIIFGTRNVVGGARLLAAGMAWDRVLEVRLLPGAGDDIVRKSGLSVAPTGL